MDYSGTGHDRLTQWVKVRLTREGWQFLFMLAFVVFAAILQNINLLVLIAGAFAALLLLQWRLAKRTLVGIRIERMIPSIVEAGKPVAIELALENTRRWLGSWILAIEETVVREAMDRDRRGSPDVPITLMLNHLLPQRRRSVRYECRFAGRGAYRFKNTQLSTLFPFSLMRGIVTTSSESRVVVHPKQGRMTATWAGLLGIPSFGQDKHRHIERTGSDGEFYSLRDYRIGDTPRLIHWRTSAKRNSLVVRQMERLENHSLIVALDLYRDEEAAELAAEVAATLLTRLTHADQPVSFALIEPECELQPIRTRIQLREALDRIALGKVQTEDRLPDFLRRVVAETRDSDSVLIISTRESVLKNLIESSSSNADASGLFGSSSSVADRSLSKTVWLDVRADSLSQIFTRG